MLAKFIIQVILISGHLESHFDPTLTSLPRHTFLPYISLQDAHLYPDQSNRIKKHVRNKLIHRSAPDKTRQENHLPNCRETGRMVPKAYHLEPPSRPKINRRQKTCT